MKMLTEYFDLQKKIYDHFGYEEDWVVIPLDDNTDSYWFLTEEQVVFSDDPFNEATLGPEGGNFYSAHIYRQRFLTKWVYRANDYTMICADTRVDGNKFLMVFDNSKEGVTDACKKLHADYWGGF